jgi:hypothetical protein
VPTQVLSDSANGHDHDHGHDHGHDQAQHEDPDPYHTLPSETAILTRADTDIMIEDTAAETETHTEAMMAVPVTDSQMNPEAAGNGVFHHVVIATSDGASIVFLPDSYSKNILIFVLESGVSNRIL